MRRWLCVASAPGTGDSQALAPAPRARSLAPPPPPPPPSPRRPNPPAHTDPKGREPACLAPRNRGRRGGEGKIKDPENSPSQSPSEAWGAGTHGRSSPGRPGGWRRQSEPGGEGQDWGDTLGETLKPEHFQTPSSLPLLSLQGDVPDTQRSAKDVPKLLLRLKGPALHGSAQHTGQDSYPARRLSLP